MNLFKKASGKFYDKWESTGQDERQKIILNKLDEYIQFSRNLSFYKQRLAGYKKKADFPLAQVPVLTSKQVRRLLPPKSNVLMSLSSPEFNNGVNVFQSGGTTGIPKTSFFSYEEMEKLTFPNARGFYALGLNEKDRVANLFAVGGLYMTFIHINRMLQEYGCMNFPFSNHTSSDFMLTVIKLFKINCMAGIASILLNALREMNKIEPGAIKIQKIFYGGERLYEADKKELQEKFGAKIVAAPGYGTIDTWYIGYQCLKCPVSVYHAHDDQCYIEIVDEETNKHCSPGEVGMIYVTPFLRRLTPIIRYRVGDKAKWLGRPCKCGRTTPLFELLGRGDDVLRIGYDSIDYDFIQKSISKIKELSTAVQMQKKREHGKDRLILRVETEVSPKRYAKMVQIIKREIITNRPTLRSAIEKKMVLPLKVELFKPGCIARNPRTGKFVRVIDVL